MKWAMESIYTITVGPVTVMAYYRYNDCWEVYYSRPDFPFLFAFGLPKNLTVDGVLKIGAANIENYTNLFTDGGVNND